MTHWKNWSIHTRLILITILPVLYLFCSVVFYSYYSRLNMVREELADRAHIVTTTLAEGVQTNIISENIPALRLTINEVLQSDSSIYRIDILDAQKNEIVHVTSLKSTQPETRHFDAAIKRPLVWVNVQVPTTPPAQEKIQTKPVEQMSEALGYVRVTMSPEIMLSKQNQQFYIEVIMTALALTVSGWLGLYLSRSLTRPLKIAIDALHDIRGGNYVVQLAITSGGEIGDLQTSINDMSVSLNRSKQDLENKVQERTQDLMQSRNEALKSDAEKRKLIQKVNAIIEDERKSIAIEIHDELNASLIAARLDAQRILHLATKTEATPVFDEIQEKACSIIQRTLTLYANGRNLVSRLRPEVLDMLGLHGAVEEMLQHYNKNQSACHFSFQSVGDFSRLESALSISAYRIIQEALSNVVKHASASKAWVSLTLMAEENKLLLEIGDNGRGFHPTLNSSGIGITGMRERVYAFGGEITITTEVHNGTLIAICMPLSPGVNADTAETIDTPNSKSKT